MHSVCPWPGRPGSSRLQPGHPRPTMPTSTSWSTRFRRLSAINTFALEAVAFPSFRRLQALSQDPVPGRGPAARASESATSKPQRRGRHGGRTRTEASLRLADVASRTHRHSRCLGPSSGPGPSDSEVAVRRRTDGSGEWHTSSLLSESLASHGVNGLTPGPTPTPSLSPVRVPVRVRALSARTRLRLGLSHCPAAAESTRTVIPRLRCSLAVAQPDFEIMDQGFNFK